jgi:hypothetical protein
LPNKNLKIQENSQIMFQICVLEQKVQGKITNSTFVKLFLYTIIRNIKIHNILDIIEILKSMEPNKCTH